MAADSLLTLAAEVGTAMKQRGWAIALAESCTGGMAAQYITAIPGSSAWFERGFVTYSNASKMELLNVPATTLEDTGAVSEATAQAMALGVLQHSHAQLAGAITGIAGPDGGSADKPVGTVCFSWSQRNGQTLTETRRFTGDREAIRRQSVQVILAGLLELASTT